MNPASCRALARRIPTTKRTIQAISQNSPRRSLATIVDNAQKVGPCCRFFQKVEIGTNYFQDPTEFDQITTLPNGIRVATEALPGPFSGIGVYVDAGSRYENEDLRGVSHIIDRLAFKVSGSFDVVRTG